MGHPMRTVDQDSLVEVEEVEALGAHQIHLVALGAMISSSHWGIAEPTKLSGTNITTEIFSLSTRLRRSPGTVSLSMRQI